MDSIRKDSQSIKPRRTRRNDLQRAEKERVRVVIADDDPVILDQIGSLLQTSFDVVGRAANGRELLEAVQQLSPAVAVVDITMPELNGIEATRQITKANRTVKVVILSVLSDYAFVEAACDAGASGYVVKLHAFTDLIPAIEKVLGGQQFWPRRDLS